MPETKLKPARGQKGMGSHQGDVHGWLCLSGLTGPQNSNQPQQESFVFSTPHTLLSPSLSPPTTGYLSLAANYVLKSKAQEICERI